MKATVTTMLPTLADVACAGEMKLLNDHLRITLPDGAEYFTPITEKTEPEASNHQVEIRIGQGNESIILEFAETYLADARFAERVKTSMAQLNSEGNHFGIAQIGDNLVYAVMREEALAAKELMDGETTPFAFAEYRHPDGTAQQFGFRVGSRLVKDAQKVPRAGHRMAQKREARRNSARPAGARGAPGELHERLPPGRRREEVSWCSTRS